MTPVLVVGFPRSGTTWVARALAAGFCAEYLHEPDNEKLHVAALAAKVQLGRFPALGPSDTAPLFHQLWMNGLAGGPSRAARIADRVYTNRFDTEAAMTQHHPLVLSASKAVLRLRPTACDALVVKSVHAPLCLEYITGVAPCQVVVVTRDPRNVLASWIGMAMPDADRRLDERGDVSARYVQQQDLPKLSRHASPFERIVWQCALFTRAIRDVLERNPTWVAVNHENLAEAGVAGFETLADRLGLSWSVKGSDFVRANARAGVGYAVNRDPATLRRGWLRTLSESQVETAGVIFHEFGLEDEGPLE